MTSHSFKDRAEQEKQYRLILDELTALRATDISENEFLKQVCITLDQRIPHYDWTGFYIVDRPGILKLGPYVGEPTDHVEIPFGRGICGQAAATGKTFVIDDVSAQSNYLSCSFKVRSEIVVPIFRNNTLWGELDIDSHTPDAFNELDRWLLEEVGRVVD